MSQEVLEKLTGLSSCKVKNEKDLRKEYPSSFTAYITGAKKLYSLYKGLVEFIGYYKGTGTLTIAVSNHEIVRYLNVENIQVYIRSNVLSNQYLADVSKDAILGFEYCTQWMGTSKYPVRINDRTYFKQNPIDLLDGLYTPVDELDTADGINRPNDIYTFDTMDQWKEWKMTDQLKESFIDKDVFQITDVKDIPEAALAMLSDNGRGNY